VESFSIELVEARIIEIPQQHCKCRSPALVHAPPLTFVEQMRIELIIKFTASEFRQPWYMLPLEQAP
jgi:hypothetical protein